MKLLKRTRLIKSTKALSSIYKNSKNSIRIIIALENVIRKLTFFEDIICINDSKSGVYHFKIKIMLRIISFTNIQIKKQAWVFAILSNS